METNQVAHGFKVPLLADSVESPIVNYGGGLTCVHFLTEDGRWGRITFESLDAIKVSRGEYGPFTSVKGEQNEFHWVNVISNSGWLEERYQYEKRHYGLAYNFGGNVDEMSTDFSHFVFSFHDQFVEALAAGIWLESAETMMSNKEMNSDHPLRGLKNAPVTERFEAHGITCQVRRSLLPLEKLEERARLCSQPILEIGAELDGRVGTNWTLTRRVKDGVGKTLLRGYFGNAASVFDDIPPLSAIRPAVDQWLAEVRQRRNKMGKS